MAGKKQNEDKARPVGEVKSGFVKAAIWRNDTEHGPRYSVTFARLYKTDEGWRSTASFNHRDMADVVRAAVQAEAWVREHAPKGEEAAA